MKTISLNFTVVYPKVDRQWPSPSDPERSYTSNVTLESDVISRHNVADRIFGEWQHTGLGNESEAFLKLRTRSMSVGDLIHFENSALWYLCDGCGWLTIPKTQAIDWMNHPRKYGCDMFELNEWKNKVGIKA